MAKIIVELHYFSKSKTSFAWVYRKLGENVEIKKEDLAGIAQRHEAITITAEQVVVRLLVSEPMLYWPRFVRLPKTIITVTGDEEGSVKNCVTDLLKLYGIPDEIPRGLWGSKKVGKRIAESALKELGL